MNFPDHADAPRTDRWLFRLAVIFAVLPILSVRIAPLCDFPNHLARVHVLAHYASEPGWANFYSLGNWVLPNLAIDAVAVPAAIVLGTELAGTAFLLLLALVVVYGAAGIARAHRRSTGVAGLLAVCALYSNSLAYGLVNYVFGLGMLLVCLGAWIARRESSPLRRIAVSVPLALVLFFSHLMAFAFYVLAIACYEIVDLWKPKTRGSVTSHAVAAGTQFVLPALLFFGFSPTRGEAGGWTALPWDKKFDQLGSVFLLGGPSSTGDLVFTAAFACVVLALVVAARGRLRPSGLVILSCFTLLFVIAPQRTATADNISLRVPAAIALLLAGFFEVRAPRGTRARTFALIALTALAAGRTAQVMYKWIVESPVYDSILEAASGVPDGATVFTLRDRHHRDHIRQTWHPPLAHAACLVAFEREVYLPQLFANEAQQPLVVRSPKLRELRYLGDDFLPTYRNQDEFDHWIARFREAVGVVPQLRRGSDGGIAPAAIFHVHVEDEPVPEHPALVRIAHGARWTLWLCDP